MVFITSQILVTLSPTHGWIKATLTQGHIYRVPSKKRKSLLIDICWEKPIYAQGHIYGALCEELNHYQILN